MPARIKILVVDWNATFDLSKELSFTVGMQMKSLRIGSYTVGSNQRVFIVAEAGVNHNKSVELAKKLVDIAKAAGVDAVKFQTWNVEELYVADEVSGGTYQEKSRERCLSYNDFVEIKKYCDEVGILFLSTPDEEKSTDFLDALGVPAFKIGSGELANLPLLTHIAKKGKPVILSTGMGDEKLIRKAVEAITHYNHRLILLYCVSSYPASSSEISMPVMSKLRDTYKSLVGFSDHTLGNVAAVLAVTHGASLIEKHFTFDKKAAGPDHAMSLNPEELTSFVHDIRIAEEMERTKKRTLSKAELATKRFAWKSAVASRDIAIGEKLSLENTVFKRPGTGITVDAWDSIQGKKVKRSVKAGQSLKKTDIA